MYTAVYTLHTDSYPMTTDAIHTNDDDHWWFDDCFGACTLLSFNIVNDSNGNGMNGNEVQKYTQNSIEII